MKAKTHGQVQTKILELYTPHEIQRQFHRSDHRFRIAALGRQSGKSTMCLNELVKRAWENPGHVYWFISPTFDQAKVQYRRLVGMLWNNPEVLLKKNQTELRVKFINQAEIVFKSGEVLENLRGSTLHGVVIDEVREQHKDLWPLVIRPMLTTTKGWAAFVSTPSGFDSFYDLYEIARGDDSNQWTHFSSPSTCNPLFTEEEYQAAKKQMTHAQFQQEIEAKFLDLHQGSAYLNFGDASLSFQNPFYEKALIHPLLPIVVGMDFNLNPMCWTLGQFRNDDSYWFDEIHLEKSHTQEAAKELIARVKDHKPGIILAGDATSKAGQRAAAGKSDYDILCGMLDEADIKWINRTPDSNPTVKDRVNTVNARLKAADDSIHLWIHPKNCPYLVKDLQRVSWKKGATMILDQTTDPSLTHQSDGVGYAVCVMAPLTPIGSVGVLRMVKR